MCAGEDSSLRGFSLIHLVEHFVLVEAMHELQRSNGSVWRARLIDVDHRSVKLIQAPPFLLTWVHDIDLPVFEWPLCLDILDYCFCRIAQSAGTSREEGYATVEEAAARTKHWEADDVETGRDDCLLWHIELQGANGMDGHGGL